MHNLRELQDLLSYRVITPEQPVGQMRGLAFTANDWKVCDFLVGNESESLVIPTTRFRAIHDARKELELESTSGASVGPSVHLHDAARMLKHKVIASDGPAGTVLDFLINVATWQLRYFVINTPGPRVLTDVEWCVGMDHQAETVTLDLSAQKLATAPPYTELTELCQGDEEALYRHYTGWERAM